MIWGRKIRRKRRCRKGTRRRRGRESRRNRCWRRRRRIWRRRRRIWRRRRGIWKRRRWRRRRWDLNLNKRRVPGGILSGTVGTRATWEITSFCSEYLTEWSAVYVVDWLKFIQVHLSFDCL